LFRREALHTLTVNVADNASNMLPMLFLLARRAGYRVGLVGTVQYERAGGQAKGGDVRNAIRTIREDMRLRQGLKHQPRRSAAQHGADGDSRASAPGPAVPP